MHSLRPAPLASVNESAQLKDTRVIRQGPRCDCELCTGAVIIEISPIQVCGHGKVRIARIRSQPKSRIDRGFCQRQAVRGVIPGEVKIIVSSRQLAICQKETGITSDRLVKDICASKRILFRSWSPRKGVNQCGCRDIKTIGTNITCWLLCDRRFFIE